MRIITADETGLVKVVRAESGECLAVSAGEQARERAIQTLCHTNLYSSTNDTGNPYSSKCVDYSNVHVARAAGVVETWGVSHSERDSGAGQACSLNLRVTIQCPAGPLAVADLSPTTCSSDDRRFLTCSEDGAVCVFAAGEGEWKPSVNFPIRGPISAAIALGTGVTGNSGAAVAAGGRENDLKIYDVSSERCTWKAKNAPHDFLDLRQPVWISSLRPLAPEEGLRRIVAGTAHRQVRLYDTRAQKRPTQSIDADEHGITTMAVAPGGQEVVVADTAGLVRVLDLRKLKWGRRFAGPAGSVRGMAFHPTLPCLACVGLDRMARFYDYKTSEPKHQIYLKQRLNAILFDDEGEVSVNSGGKEDATAERPKGRSGNGESGSGDEGWGSGEEYEMDDYSSSSGDEEEEQKEATRRARSNGFVPHTMSTGVQQQNGQRHIRSGAEADDSDSESEYDSESEEEDEEGGTGVAVKGGRLEGIRGGATHGSEGKEKQPAADGNYGRGTSSSGGGNEGSSGGDEDESESGSEEDYDHVGDDGDVEGGRGFDEAGGVRDSSGVAEDEESSSGEEGSSSGDGESDGSEGSVEGPPLKRRAVVGKKASGVAFSAKRR